MLQKLLIALCTIFVLSACGGDLDLGPENPPPQNGDTDEPDNGDDEEPGEPEIFAEIRFDEEASIDTWAYRCVESCDATAELSWNADEEVLAVTPEWASEADNLEIYSPVEEVSNMEGANASAWVFVTEDYVADGNLAMHLLLSNANGTTGYGPAVSVDAGWNRVDIWEMALTSEEEVAEGEEDYGTFLVYEEGFSLLGINEVGVRFAANEKPVDVGGQLWIDNVVLTPGSGSGPLEVDMESENWSVLDATGVELQQADGTVAFSPTATGQKLAYMLDGPADLVNRSFTFTFTVDQAFKASGADIQPIVQQNFGSYTGNFGECYIGNGEFEADEPFETTCDVANDQMVAEEGQTLRVGFQVEGEPAGTVTINSMEIDAGGMTAAGPFALTATADNVESAWDNDNWQNRDGAPDLSFNEAEGVLAIAPNWDATDNNNERTVMYVAGEDELPELEGATVGYELYIPDYYVTDFPGMQFQFFIQQSSDPFTGLFGDNYDISDAEELGDGWYRFERTFTDVPTDPAALRVGLKLQRSSMENDGEAGAELWLRQITIE